MKRKTFFVFLALMFFAALPFSNAFAAGKTVSSAELIANASAYDGKTVMFEGEAIGNVLIRGDHAWVNVSDANNSALGVFMPAGEAAKVRTTGKYGVTGDTLLVTGVFHRACTEHGGDLDIHAERVELLRSGKAAPPEYPAWLPWLAGAAALCACVLCALAYFLTHRAASRPGNS